MLHLCKMMIYICRCYFHFFKILILCVVSGGNGIKGQKMVQNEKKFCLLCSISQESYIIWFSFVVLMFKMIIPPGFFFHFFKILIFQVVRGVKGQKIAHIILDISGTIHHMILIFGARV